MNKWKWFYLAAAAVSLGGAVYALCRACTGGNTTDTLIGMSMCLNASMFALSRADREELWEDDEEEE